SLWRGAVDAQVELEQRADGFPRIHAVATMSGISGGTWPAVDGRAEVRLDWPRVEVMTLNVRDAAGSTVEAAGTGDLDARRIETLSLQGRLERASAEPWLPPTVGFDHVTWHATAHGAIDALEHEGELRTREVAVDPLKPASVVLAWRGRMLEADVDATTEVP